MVAAKADYNSLGFCSFNSHPQRRDWYREKRRGRHARFVVLTAKIVKCCFTRHEVLRIFQGMEVKNIKHKALRNFARTGETDGLPGNLVQRIRNMLAYLAAIEDEDELKIPPNFGAHLLKHNRASAWSLMVTRNWRMTFRINDSLEIEEIGLEDYH